MGVRGHRRDIGDIEKGHSMDIGGMSSTSDGHII